jgi:hypothetical protein
VARALTLQLAPLVLLAQVESVVSQSQLFFHLPANQEAMGSLLVTAVFSPESSNAQPLPWKVIFTYHYVRQKKKAVTVT